MQDYGTLKMTKGELDFLYRNIAGQLTPALGMPRNRVRGYMEKTVNELDTEREALFAEHWELDENGERKWNHAGERPQPVWKDEKVFLEKFNKIMFEKVSFPLVGSQIMDWKALKDIWKNLDATFDVRDTRTYEAVLKLLEEQITV